MTHIGDAVWGLAFVVVGLLIGVVAQIMARGKDWTAWGLIAIALGVLLLVK